MAGADDVGANKPEDGSERGAQSDPRARLMQEVADQMDAIESDFGDSFEIGTVMTIVEVRRPDGSVGIRVRNNAPLWVGLGLLKVAEKILEGRTEA